MRACASRCPLTCCLLPPALQNAPWRGFAASIDCTLLPGIACTLLPGIACTLLPDIACTLLPGIACTLLPGIDCTLLPDIACTLVVRYLCATCARPRHQGADVDGATGPATFRGHVVSRELKIPGEKIGLLIGAKGTGSTKCICLRVCVGGCLHTWEVLGRLVVLCYLLLDLVCKHGACGAGGGEVAALRRVL